MVKPVLVLFPHFAADYANAHLHTAKAAFLVQELIQETHVQHLVPMCVLMKIPVKCSVNVPQPLMTA